MASEVYTSMGTLATPQTVVLDYPAALPLGRVRVLVEALPTSSPERAWLNTLTEIRRALQQSGYRARSQEEIDAQLQAERDSWDNA
jgi:hypothetical protein